jgi:hypothetical protein
MAETRATAPKRYRIRAPSDQVQNGSYDFWYHGVHHGWPYGHENGVGDCHRRYGEQNPHARRQICKVSLHNFPFVNKYEANPAKVPSGRWSKTG